MLNDGGHRIISKIVTVMKRTYYFLTFKHVKKANEKTTSNECRFLQKYGIGQSYELVRQKTVTENWYTTKYLPEILQEGNVRGQILHYDNEFSVEFQFINKTIKVIEHSPYTPDLAITYVDVVFIQKRLGCCYKCIFSSIPRNEWLEAFNLWKIRLQKCIDAGRDYFEYALWDPRVPQTDLCLRPTDF
ncbi:UNVERIFIED_CONTAM: hypothetical protein NCL1_31433 [Trichonephila clavipes]